jgi:SAM-dependent methyltransferase
MEKSVLRQIRRPKGVSLSGARVTDKPVYKLGRTDMTGKSGEVWRPPLFRREDSFPRKVLAGVRRFADLQAGSIWRDLAQILPQVTGQVLDVGCGAQPYRILFSDKTVYLGIDTIESGASFGYENSETRYFEGSTWPVEDASIDFVLCTETLEHVRSPEALLHEAYRCLRRGGTLLLTVPFAARWHFIPHDYWRFTPSGLDYLLSQTGFVGRHVYARGNAATVACYKALALLLRLAMPQSGSLPVRVLLMVCFLPLLPLAVLVATLGNITMRGNGGDDCLGYTAIAQKDAT